MGSAVTPFTEGAAEAEAVLPFAPLAAVVEGVGVWATWITSATPVMGAAPPRAGEVDPEDDPVGPEEPGGGEPLPTVGGTVGGAVGGTVGVVVGAVVVDGGGCVVGGVLGTVVVGPVPAGRVIGEAMSGRRAFWKEVRCGLLGAHTLLWPRPCPFELESSRSWRELCGGWGEFRGALGESYDRELDG
jgi:hypothetical protein